MSTHWIFALCLVTLSSACSGGTTVNVTDFNQSCQTDQDCSVVVTGEICQCACPNAAINQSDLASYQAEVDDHSKSCGPRIAACIACPDVVGSCQAGRCAVKAGGVGSPGAAG